MTTFADLTRTQLLRRCDELERLAFHDELTGLLNERGLRERIQASGGAGWFVLCDLDGFKGVNDRYGHAAGDVVLSEFATFLHVNARRGSDVIACRLHGDEFVVWVSPSKGNPEAGARRILELVHGWRSNAYPEASASAGAGPDLASADEAMYASKRERVKGALPLPRTNQRDNHAS